MYKRGFKKNFKCDILNLRLRIQIQKFFENAGSGTVFNEYGFLTRLLILVAHSSDP
jgi:hypothetical protein